MRKMTPGQEKHLSHLLLTFGDENDKKYRAGQKEHKGNLYDQTPIQLAYNLREEAIDAFNYAQTLIDNLEKQDERS